MEKPQSHEYPQSPYTSRYVNQVSGNPLDVLRQKSSWQLLHTLDEEKAAFRYAPDKWSIKELVGHITDCERIFAYRLLCIARGEKQSLPGFDENDYVATAHFDQRTLASLLAEYLAVRESTLHLCETLSTEMLAQTGTANGNTISVRVLLFILTGHEQHHIQILKERYLLPQPQVSH